MFIFLARLFSALFFNFDNTKIIYLLTFFVTNKYLVDFFVEKYKIII